VTPSALPVYGLGVWLILNGLLHDVFVLRSEHGRKYDRILLRLLMDGHILMTGGAVLLFCGPGVAQRQWWAFYISVTVCLSILVYCAMIFPFLKSIGTILFSATLLVILCVYFL